MLRKNQKSLFLLLVVFSFLSIKAQDMRTSLHYASEGAIGVISDANFTGNTKMSYGIAVYMYLSEGIGRDYTQVFGPAYLREEVYEITEGVDLSFYGTLGYEVTDLVLVRGLLGLTTRRIYYNGYDEYQILNPSGYYYTSTEGRTSFSYGLIASYKATKNFLLEAGFTNQEKVSVGIGYRVTW